MKLIFEQLAQGKDLPEPLAKQAFEKILSGAASDAEIGAFLGMLAQKGESVTEITAGMQILQSKATQIEAPENTMDLVGTGGDGLCSYNVSTNSSIIVAAAGVPVAKHGNRAVSSQSGASDVLNALGVNIQAAQAVMQKSLNEIGLNFMFAPLYHKTVANVMPARQALGIRSIFNFLGPICNPARVKYILLGLSNSALLPAFANVLLNLEFKNFLVVSAENHMDEISLSCPTHMIHYDGKNLNKVTIKPEDFGLKSCTPEELRGGDANDNAQAIRAVLRGETSPCYHLVLLNSAAALWVAGKVKNLTEGLELAKQTIASGAAMAKLEEFIKITHS